jgi:hypothetical protein
MTDHHSYPDNVEALAEKLQQHWQGGGHAYTRPWDNGTEKDCVHGLPGQAEFFRQLARIAIPAPAQGSLDPATVEACAKFVEQHQERITETERGSERSVSPRMVGNQMGLAYATGIRAALPSTELAPEEREDPWRQSFDIATIKYPFPLIIGQELQLEDGPWVTVPSTCQVENEEELRERYIVWSAAQGLRSAASGSTITIDKGLT